MASSLRDALRFRGALDEHDPSDKPLNARRKKLDGPVATDDYWRVTFVRTSGTITAAVTLSIV